MYCDICAGHSLCLDLQSFQLKLNNLCIDKKWQLFNVNEISIACHKLKPDKKDANLTLMSNAFLNAPSLLFSLLCVLINAITIYGFILQLWFAVTSPHLLNSANLDKSLLSSFRPIMFSSLFGQIVGLLILDCYFD